MQGKMTSVEAGPAVYAGVDVCKAWLDVYLHPIGRKFRVPNSKEGCERLALALTSAAAGLVVMEATGKLHRLAHRELSAAGFAVAVVNPYRSKKARRCAWPARQDRCHRRTPACALWRRRRA